MEVPQFIAGRFRIEREIGTGGMGTVLSRLCTLGCNGRWPSRLLSPNSPAIRMSPTASCAKLARWPSCVINERP